MTCRTGLTFVIFSYFHNFYFKGVGCSCVKDYILLLLFVMFRVGYSILEILELVFVLENVLEKGYCTQNTCISFYVVNEMEIV